LKEEVKYKVTLSDSFHVKEEKAMMLVIEETLLRTENIGAKAQHISTVDFAIRMAQSVQCFREWQSDCNCNG